MVTLAVGGIAFWSTAGGREGSIPMADLPEAVVKAVQNAFPEGKWTKVRQRDDDDELIYVVELAKSPTSRSATLQLSNSGQLLEIDEEISTNDLPERVLRAVSKAFPGGTIDQAEQESEMEIIYRVQLTTHGKKREVKLTRKGRILEIEKKR